MRCSVVWCSACECVSIQNSSKSTVRNLCHQVQQEGKCFIKNKGCRRSAWYEDLKNRHRKKYEECSSGRLV